MRKIKLPTEQHPIEVWEVEESGKITVFYNGDLVSEKRAVTRQTEHVFQVENDGTAAEAYLLVVTQVGIEYEFTLSINGVVVKEIKVQTVTEESPWERDAGGGDGGSVIEGYNFAGHASKFCYLLVFVIGILLWRYWHRGNVTSENGTLFITL